MDLSNIKRDFQSREDGDWIEVPKLGNISLKVRGLASDLALAFRANLEKKVAITDRVDGDIKPEIKRQHWQECLIEAILIDWKGLTDGQDENGQPIQLPYSKEMARKLITEPEFELFADAVMWAASRVDEGKAVTKENTTKKPKTPS